MAYARPTKTISTFRLRRRTPGTFVLVPCERMGRSIRCQGQLEAAAARILTACPLVAEILEQPCSIRYLWRENPPEIQLLGDCSRPPLNPGEHASYIVPDFLVTMQGGWRRLLEIKPSRMLNDPVVRRKLAVARFYAAQQGWQFHVATEKQLFAGPLLANLRLLSRFRSIVAEPSLLESLTSSAIEPATTVVGLRERYALSGDRAQVRAAVMHLLATGRIEADILSHPLTSNSSVYPQGTFPWDPFVSVWGPSGSWTDAPSGSSVRQGQVVL